jgi:hypothetical protein
MLEGEARAKLKVRLDEVHEWPSVYMYKMILEPDPARLEAVLALFPPEADVLRRYSKGGRFISITVKEVMMSAEEVLQRYDKASEIKGVMIL